MTSKINMCLDTYFEMLMNKLKINTTFLLSALIIATFWSYIINIFS